MMSSFEDPSFRQASDVLWQTTSAAIIEWLRRGGTVGMLAPRRRPAWQRWSKRHLATFIGLGAGSALWGSPEKVDTMLGRRQYTAWR